MPDTAYVGVEMDTDLIDRATKVLHDTGFTLADAIHLMVAKTARDGRLPFDAEAALEEEYGEEIPNALTHETIEKAERGEEVYYAKDFDDLMAQLRS